MIEIVAAAVVAGSKRAPGSDATAGLGSTASKLPWHV